jgi:hypothetical protein
LVGLLIGLDARQSGFRCRFKVMVRALPLLGLGSFLAAAAAVMGPPAHAHAIQSTLERVQAASESLMVSSAFSSGEPASDAAVRLVPPGGGSAIEVGRTNAQGQLSFGLPKGAKGDWELQIDGGPGHRDYLEMPVRQGRVQLDKISQDQNASWRLDLATLLAGGGAVLAGAVAEGWRRSKHQDRC